MPEQRNHAVDLIKAEALYVALRDANVYIPYGVREAFMTAFAAALTDMRLRP